MSEKVSSCERDHLINILNFEDGTVVSHPIILLNGTIRNVGSCNEKLYIKHYHENIMINIIPCSVHNAKFKCLVKLQDSRNMFHLSYCNTKFTLLVKYNVVKFQNVVTPVLIICNDDNGLIHGPDSYAKSINSSSNRLLLAMQLMQCFFAEKTLENTSTRKTFSIELENDSPVCIVHKSKLPLSNAQEMNEESLWQYFGKELMTSKYASHKRKFLALLTCSKYIRNDDKICYENIKNNTKCYASVGKGNLALIGNPYFYTWPEKIDEVLQRFEDCTSESFVSQNQKTDQLIQTIGGCYSLSFGAALHELGHIFDLGHSQYGLMGREYIHVDKIFSFGRYDINPQAPYSVSKKKITPDGNLINSNKTTITILKKPTLIKSKNAHADIDQYFAYILYYHKWFNNSISSIDHNSELFNYDYLLNELVALNYLGIVQLRQVEHELVEHSCIPEKKSYKWVMNTEYFGKTWYLFAIDVHGNVFHCITKC